MRDWTGRLLTTLALLLATAGALAQRLSLTFDDGFDARQDPQAAALNAELLAALAAQRVPAMLFPAGRVVDGEAGMALVQDWSRAGHAIGNHSWSHRSLGSPRMTLAVFTDDLLRAHRHFSHLPGWVPMLRFPYLKEGDTADKRDGLRAWLRQQGWRPAPVSIDTSDWYYNQRYLALQQQGRTADLPRLRQAFLQHLLDKARAYDQLAHQVLGRSPAHVMLLHANAINAAWVGDVVQMFRDQGWTLVSPQQAFDDPLYAMAPQGLPAGESIVWALARDAGVAGLRYPAEDGDYEAPVLDALGL